MTDAVAVRVRGISREFSGPAGQVIALHPLDLDVDIGSMTAVTGRSGSGKTTLLNMIGALDHPTTGEIEVFGDRVDLLPTAAGAAWRAATVGFVFQAPGLMPTMSAAENIDLGLRITGISGRDDRARRTVTALDRVGLSDRADHRPAELSGGQRQRVAIARALAAEHRLILADEPTAGLDTATAREIFGLLRDVATSGTTILLATHDSLGADYVDRTFDLAARA